MRCPNSLGGLGCLRVGDDPPQTLRFDGPSLMASYPTEGVSSHREHGFRDFPIGALEAPLILSTSQRERCLLYRVCP